MLTVYWKPFPVAFLGRCDYYRNWKEGGQSTSSLCQVLCWGPSHCFIPITQCFHFADATRDQKTSDTWSKWQLGSEPEPLILNWCSLLPLSERSDNILVETRDPESLLRPALREDFCVLKPLCSQPVWHLKIYCTVYFFPQTWSLVTVSSLNKRTALEEFGDFRVCMTLASMVWPVPLCAPWVVPWELGPGPGLVFPRGNIFPASLRKCMFLTLESPEKSVEEMRKNIKIIYEY